MYKAAPLTGILTFAILFLFLHQAYAAERQPVSTINDDTSFYFKNATSQVYVIEQLNHNWFTIFDSKDIAPGREVSITLKGGCNINRADEQASTEWVVKRQDNKNIVKFKLEVTNRDHGKCGKRLFKVDDRYRKIELYPTPSGSPPLQTTTTPYFRFTIEDEQNSVRFVQDGPQANPFDQPCFVGDAGYDWSRGNILFDKQTGNAAYCRVVGNQQNGIIRCTVKRSNNVCTDVNSKNWDMGNLNTQYWADVNGDGIIDFCRELDKKGTESVSPFIKCILGPNFESEQENEAAQPRPVAKRCAISDAGYEWSAGIILFNAQAEIAYCRVVGNPKSGIIRCTVNSNNMCKDVNSKGAIDIGRERTQYWTDVNGDGFIDFCREVGNKLIRCRLGPTFEQEKR
jgi:hypothetical protein